jgi:ornithine--oxo-acid transaminase
VKILPPLIIGEKEVDLFVAALDDVLTECRKFPGPMWEIGQNFVRAAMGNKRVTPQQPAPPVASV